jgi:hypothetical protein
MHSTPRAYRRCIGPTCRPHVRRWNGIVWHSNIPGQAGYDGRCAAGGGKNWMTVFGFNNNGAWELYSQEIVNDAISNAYRVW